jgi:hypothetical protein
MKRTLPAALALVLTAATGPALAAASADPPPPAGLAPDQIEAWVEQYIDHDHDQAAAATDRMVLFYAPDSVKVTSPGQVDALIHGEQYVVQQIGPGPIRSFRDVWRFDCAQRRFLLIESEIFPQSNLQGGAKRLDTSMERWSPSFAEGVGPGSLIAQVCRDAGVAVGAPPDGV